MNSYPPLPDPEKEFSKFLMHLSIAAMAADWVLVQHQTPFTDRSLELRKGPQRVPFVVHLSQTSNGFWGIQFTTYRAMEEETKEHLVLLRSAGSGYFIPNPALARAKKKFSHTASAWRINEGKVRNEMRFGDLDKLVELLSGRSAA